MPDFDRITTFGSAAATEASIGRDSRPDDFASWIIYATTKTYGRADALDLAAYLDEMAVDGLNLTDVAASVRRHQDALVARVKFLRSDPLSITDRTAPIDELPMIAGPE